MACNRSSDKDKVIENKNELEGNITILSSGDAAKALNDAAVKFSKQYPKVQIEVKEVKDASSYVAVSAALASGVSMPDMFTIEGDKVQLLASSFPDKILDLTSEVSSNKDKYLKSKQEEIEINKKIYGYPWTGEPIALFYRDDIFKAAGINGEDIKTWQQYIDSSKTINAYSKKDVKMLAVQDMEELYRVLLCELGTGYFNNSDKSVLASQSSIKAMTMLKSLKDANLIYNYTDMKSLISEIKNGNVVSLQMNVLGAKILKEQCNELNGKWNVMELPAFEYGGKTAAASSGLDIMVTSSAKDKKAVQQFARFVTREANTSSDAFIKYGLFPCYTPLLNDSTFENKVGYFNGQKIWRVFNKVSKEVKGINYTSNNIETKQAVKEAVDKIINKNEDIKITLEELQKNIEAKINKK